MSGQSVGKFSDARWDRAIAFLRALHPAKTADCVAADTGIKPDTVRKLLAGASEPTFRHYTRMLFAYGPEFAACIYSNAPDWLRAEVRADKRARLEAEIAVKQKELDSLLAAR